MQIERVQVLEGQVFVNKYPNTSMLFPNTSMTQHDAAAAQQNAIQQ